jgi:hypothetical protein
LTFDHFLQSLSKDRAVFASQPVLNQLIQSGIAKSAVQLMNPATDDSSQVFIVVVVVVYQVRLPKSWLLKRKEERST